jgi:type IV pilus assembly protein PilA
MSNLIRKAQKGFTLIELMIVVAIIGILAAIAIPNFLRFQLKSKSSEGKVNIAAIRTAEESYLAEFGAYVAAAAFPLTAPSAQKQVFSPVPADFDRLGWTPEGNVFFQYAVAYASATPSAYSISAIADIDADTLNQGWGYVKPDNTGATIAPVHAECVVGGVGPAQDQLSTVGPCDATSGQSKF